MLAKVGNQRVFAGRFQLWPVRQLEGQGDGRAGTRRIPGHCAAIHW